jgi:hypothetical protein
MDYVLGTHCQYKDHDKDNEGLAYLHGGEGTEIELLVFTCKTEAYDFLKENRLDPDHVLVIPLQEAIFDE